MRSTQRFLSCLLVSAITLSVLGCGRAPQIGEDETAWKEVEALYTAVTARRKDLVEASLKRMQTLHDEGRMSKPAFDRAHRIASQAQSGEWEPAAQALWQFMRGQRKSR